MKKILKFLLATGYLLQPISFVGLLYIAKAQNLKALGIRECFIFSFVPQLIYLSEQSSRISRENAFSGKEKALNPKITKKLLFKKPTGIVLGKKGRQYVCKDLNTDGHIFLIGGSGSGKSSCLVIPTLLSNPQASIFAIDIKGELSLKTARYTDDHIQVFNPMDPNQQGQNPFYSLNDKSSNQDILETMRKISYSLIPLPPDIKDPFWKISSRNLLIGLLMYYYKQGQTEFIPLIDEILSHPVEESIQTALDISNIHSSEYKYLIGFHAMENETLSGIVAEMNNHLLVFSNDQNIRQALYTNPKRASPIDLEKGRSIYLSIKEENLSPQYDLLQLIINQTLQQLEKRSEDAHPIIFIIDELPRILSVGKIDSLLDAARTLRSRKVTLFLITQSTEALMTAFSENEVADLISNCAYIIVLSASSIKTQKSVIEQAGKYQVKRKSQSSSGKKNATISFECVPILEGSDLVALPQTGDAILLSPYGFNRIKKTPYYKDKILLDKANTIIQHNQKNQLKLINKKEKNNMNIFSLKQGTAYIPEKYAIIQETKTSESNYVGALAPRIQAPTCIFFSEKPIDDLSKEEIYEIFYLCKTKFPELSACKLSEEIYENGTPSLEDWEAIPEVGLFKIVNTSYIDENTAYIKR